MRKANEILQKKHELQRQISAADRELMRTQKEHQRLLSAAQRANANTSDNITERSNDKRWKEERAAALAERDEARRAAQEASARKDAAEKALAEHRAALAELLDPIDPVELTQAELDQAVQQVSDMNAELDKLRDQLESAESLRNKLEADQARLDAERASMTDATKLKQTRGELEVLRREMLDNGQLITNLQERIQVAESGQEAATAQKLQAEQRLAKCQADLAKQRVIELAADALHEAYRLHIKSGAMPPGMGAFASYVFKDIPPPSAA